MSSSEIININVAFVHGQERKGRVSQITVPTARDMSVKDVREYILKCTNGEDGTVKDQGALKILIEQAGVNIESIENDPIQIIQDIMGVFGEKDIPNCPITAGTHVLFLHSTPIQ